MFKSSLNLFHGIVLATIFARSVVGLANPDQVYLCGDHYNHEGNLLLKVDFKNLKACSYNPSDVRSYCRPDAHVTLHMLGTWPETVTIDGVAHKTTLVGLRNQNYWATIRFFQQPLTPTLTHADIQGNVIVPNTRPTQDPTAPLLPQDGFCQRVIF